MRMRGTENKAVHRRFAGLRGPMMRVAERDTTLACGSIIIENRANACRSILRPICGVGVTSIGKA